MIEISSVEAVEWHDGLLEKVEIHSADVVFTFSRCYAYVRTGHQRYNVIECAATSRLGGVTSLSIQGPIDYHAWISDWELQSEGVDTDCSLLLKGTGPGTLRGTWANGAVLQAEFGTSRLELSDSFEVVDEWVGPLSSGA